jgi:hypothetical protein
MSGTQNTCGCNTKKVNETNSNEKVIEHFSLETPRNMCHYSCSSMNITNIVLVILVVVLLYLLSKEKFNF